MPAGGIGMNTSNQLIIGIILIGSGLVFALIAYWILSDRRKEDVEDELDLTEEDLPEGDKEEAEGDDEEAEGDEKEPDRDEEEHDDEEVESLPAEEVDEEESDIEEEPSAAGPPSASDDVIETAEAEEEVEIPAEEASLIPDQPPEPPPGPRATIPVADLLRDEVTGSLIVRVGDHEYRTPDELKNSDDWTRLEFAASDLADWIARASAADRIGAVGTEERPASPQSMIEQINEILQKKLIDVSGELKALRLVEGPGGAVRVLIGVRSFSLDEVPDPEASQLIRDAVAEWEGRQ
jgi:hypothetical protein